MKILYLICLLLPIYVSGADICLSGFQNAKAKFSQPQYWRFFPRGDWDGSKDVNVTEFQPPGGKMLCDELPTEVNYCRKGYKIKIIKPKEAGEVQDAGGCGMMLEIDGKTYGGRRLGNERNVCDGDEISKAPLNQGSYTSGHYYGRVIFENLPIHDCE
ncbi:hypothetical protein FQN50_004935 [Emmonsiellopsis sp. PD_5]|nr:hypothetical protein FQN50_004935 [Emmonsiellopsis sp. PD_5]